MAAKSIKIDGAAVPGFPENLKRKKQNERNEHKRHTAKILTK